MEVGDAPPVAEAGGEEEEEAVGAEDAVPEAVPRLVAVGAAGLSVGFVVTEKPGVSEGVGEGVPLPWEVAVGRGGDGVPLELTVELSVGAAERVCFGLGVGLESAEVLGRPVLLSLEEGEVVEEGVGLWVARALAVPPTLAEVGVPVGEGDSEDSTEVLGGVEAEPVTVRGEVGVGGEVGAALALLKEVGVPLLVPLVVLVRMPVGDTAEDMEDVLRLLPLIPPLELPVDEEEERLLPVTPALRVTEEDCDVTAEAVPEGGAVPPPEPETAGDTVAGSKVKVGGAVELPAPPPLNEGEDEGVLTPREGVAACVDLGEGEDRADSMAEGLLEGFAGEGEGEGDWEGVALPVPSPTVAVGDAEVAVDAEGVGEAFGLREEPP